MKNKTKKRVKELEEKFEQIVKETNESLRTINKNQKNFTDRLSIVELKGQATLENISPGAGSALIVKPTPHKSVINPTKTLEERLDVLGVVFDGDMVGFMDSDLCKASFFISGYKITPTDDEIVDKVKQIIEILK